MPVGRRSKIERSSSGCACRFRHRLWCLHRSCSGLGGFGRNRCVGFARCLAQAFAQLARKFLKGAVLFGTERRSGRCGRRRRKGQHFGRLAGRSRVLRELSASQVLKSFHVAAQAETAKSAKPAFAVEHWQARHLDREWLVEPIDWPGRHDPAERLVPGQCVCDLAGWIQRQCLGNLGPAAAERGGRLRAQAGRRIPRL